MNRLSDNLLLVNEILQKYVSIQDQIFGTSLKRNTHIPESFKSIDFAQLSDNLEILANELTEIVISNELEDLEEHSSVFKEYTTALLRTIQALLVLCIRLYAKSEGTSYSMEEYNSDVSAYQNLVAEYRAIESELIRKYQNHNTIMCKICKSGAAKEEWIYLTDGSRIHSACYDQISSYISNKESELDELKRKKEELQKKWKRELGFIAKIRRIFSREIFDEKVFWSETNMLSEAIDTLSKNIIEKREKIDLILCNLYDFWPEIPPDWEDRRQLLTDEFNYCTQCKKFGTRSTTLHVHHIVPISKGGSHRLSNLEVLCEKCHQRKHHGRSFPYKNNPSPSSMQKKIQIFQNAIDKAKYLKFNYRIYSGKKDKHIVKPISIKRSSETILLYGFCYLSNHERKFSISKISNVSILNNLDSLSINRFPPDFIDEAISKGKFLFFHYTKGTGGRSWRTIKPTHYDEYKGVKIVSGYDYLTLEIRHFAPQRMENVEILDVPKPSKVISGKP